MYCWTSKMAVMYFGIDGLNFSSLTIEQGAGDFADSVIVRNGTEYLVGNPECE